MSVHVQLMEKFHSYYVNLTIFKKKIGYSGMAHTVKPLVKGYIACCGFDIIDAIEFHYCFKFVITYKNGYVIRDKTHE